MIQDILELKVQECRKFEMKKEIMHERPNVNTLKD